MPKRSSSTKLPVRPRNPDPNQLARFIMQAAAGEVPREPLATAAPEKNPAAVALGRLGGAKGGKARAAALTKKQRSEIAKLAAKTRWAAKTEKE